jgi:hypothetical protein
MATWLDDLLGSNEPVAAQTTAPIAAPVVRLVWIQMAAPSGGNCGGTEAAHYFVEAGTVHLCDEGGKPSGQKERLSVGGNPRAVAGRIFKAAWRAATKESDFNRQLGNYSRHGVA